MKLYDFAYDQAVKVYGPEELGSNVVFDAGHVYWHLWENKQIDLMRVVMEAVPSIRPPFDHMWVEVPTTKRRGACLAVSSWACDDWGEIEDSADRLAERMGLPSAEIVLYAECPARPAAIAVRMDVWVVQNPRIGTRLMGSLFFALDSNGQPCGSPIPGASDLDTFAAFMVGMDNESYMVAARRALVTWMFAMGLIHCKNVAIVDGQMPPDKVMRKQEKAVGRPLTRFKTIEISTPKATSANAEDRPVRESSERAMHICRGHFASYGAERPLFGRYTGTFWKPAHVRGASDAGKVYKDYAVNPGKQEVPA